MAAVITGQAAAASSATTTTITVTLGSAPTAGERIIAIVGHSDDYPNVPSGFTQDGQSAITGVTRVFSKVATGSEGTSFTFTAPSAGAMSARVMRVTGLSSVDVAGGNGANGTNQMLFASVTTTAANVWLLAGAELDSTATPGSDMTWSDSFVQVAADAKSSGGTKQSMLAVAAKSVSASGSYTATASYTPAATSHIQGVIVGYTIGSAPLSVGVGSNQSIYTSQQATITATASGGSGTKTYAWTVTSGPSTSSSQFASASSASTTFTPAGGAGSYVLRCTVTDSSGSAYAELTVTVTTTPTTTSYVSITSSTGWVATGGTVQAVLADASDATLVTSPNNPSAALIDGTLGTVVAPSAGQDFVVTVRAQKLDSTSGSLVCKLYDGATLISTVTVALPDTLGAITVTFPAAEVAAMTSSTWTSGVRLTLAATAA